jgi:chromosome partitioning protein
VRSAFALRHCHRYIPRPSLPRAQEVLTREAPFPVARIIAIANQKGGVGKTTTAVNLAASLAVAEQRTLLVDGDPQGNATSGAGLVKENLDLTVYEVLIGEAMLAEAIVRAVQFKHLDVVPATPDLAGAEVELVSRPNRDQAMRTALDAIRTEYDYVLIDCPPSLGLITINMLAAADALLIPLQCEYYALEGISQLLNTVHLVQRSMNEGLAVDGVLLTMYDPRLNLSRQVAADAREVFGAKVYQTVIPRNVRLAEAPSFGKPIILYDLASVGAQAYVNLAKELLERHQAASSSELVPVADAPSVSAATSAPSDVLGTSDNKPLGNHHEHGETSATR